MKGGKVEKVRQPVNISLHARPVGGELTTTSEAAHVQWVDPAALESCDIHLALRRRIDHGLADGDPHVD